MRQVRHLDRRHRWGRPVPYTDQQNDYSGYWNDRPLSQFPEHALLRSGYVIAANLAAAEAVSP